MQVFKHFATHAFAENPMPSAFPNVHAAPFVPLNAAPVVPLNAEPAPVVRPCRFAVVVLQGNVPRFTGNRFPLTRAQMDGFRLFREDEPDEISDTAEVRGFNHAENEVEEISDTHNLAVTQAKVGGDSCFACCENVPDCKFVDCDHGSFMCAVCADKMLKLGMKCPMCRGDITKFSVMSV